MKYRYKLNNLDCANCANKIEEKLKLDTNIKNANVNFSKLMVSVETDMKIDIKKYINFNALRVFLGTIISLLGILVFKGQISKIFIILGYTFLLLKTSTNAMKLLIKSKTINENLLVTISCVGAYFTNNVNEGLMVIILYEIGKILEQVAVNRSYGY